MNPDREERTVREALAPLARVTYDADAAWQSLRSRLDVAPPPQHGSPQRIPRPLLSALSIGAVVIAIVISSVVIVVGHGKHAAKPPTVTPAGSLRSFATNTHDVTTFTDTAGGLWLSSWNDATLTKVDAQTGASTSLTVGQSRSTIIAAATADGELFDVRFDTGQLEARDATSGVVLRTAKQPAETPALTAQGNGLWVTECCQGPTPSQTVLMVDPSTLTNTTEEFVAQEGETPQLAAGPAGVWLLNEPSYQLLRVDTPHRIVILMQGSAAQVAVGTSVVLVADDLGHVTGYNPTTGALEFQLEYGVTQSDIVPTAAAIDGDDLYVAIPGHVLEFSIARKAKIGDVTGLNAQRLSVGPHGVWAATDGSLVQIATS
jgi:outer membrane protein assembly factor BamB